MAPRLDMSPSNDDYINVGNEIGLVTEPVSGPGERQTKLPPASLIGAIKTDRMGADPARL